MTRERKKQRANENLEMLLIEGLGSGKPTPVTPEYLEERRKSLREKLSRKNRKS